MGKIGKKKEKEKWENREIGKKGKKGEKMEKKKRKKEEGERDREVIFIQESVGISEDGREEGKNIHIHLTVLIH